jgi:hypothetical protein
MWKSWYRFGVVLAGCALMWSGCRACGSGEEAQEKAPKVKKAAKNTAPKAEPKEMAAKEPKELSLKERHMRPSGNVTIKPGATLRLTPIKPQRRTDKPVVNNLIDDEESRRKELQGSKNAK